MRTHLLATIDRLDAIYDDADPHAVLETAAQYASAAVEAGNMAARLGHADLYRRSLDFGSLADWPAVKAYLAECLATFPAMPEPTKPVVESPYLDAAGAANYLGITVKSLYGLVLRGRLEPLRGPRRTYRFTPKILDGYLNASGRT